MKSFICPVDFSPTATNAVEYAATLAGQLNAELFLAHIINEPSSQTISGTEENNVELNVLERLETYCRTVKETFSIKCRPILKGYTLDMDLTLKKVIEADDYDLVVMGTDGRSDISQFFLGTNTNHIIGEISVPVLVVPAGCSFKSLNRILYASNYQVEDIPALNTLIELTKKFDPFVTVLHVNKMQSKKEEEIHLIIQDIYEDKLKNQKIGFDHIHSENVAMALDSYVTENEFDLLVMVTHKYSWIRSIFHDSVTKKMSLVADYPILVQHFDNERR